MEYKKRFYVYVYLDPFKKGSFTYCDIELEYQPFYIGKGTNNRYIKHLYRARSILKHNIKYNTKNRKINKIISIIKKGQEPIPIIVYHELTEMEAYRIEKEMIDHFGIIDMHPNGILYNYKTGGDGGFTVCEESKKRMSEAAIGKIVSEETRKRMSISRMGIKRPRTKGHQEKIRKTLLESYASGKIQPWNKGLKGCYSQTEESNKKRSEKLTGVKKTKEHCKNISETRKRLHKEGILKPNERLLNQTGENNHMYGKTPHNAKNILKFDLDGNFINEYTSMKKACDDTGTLYPSKLKEICGKEIEYKGFIFKYK